MAMLLGIIIALVGISFYALAFQGMIGGGVMGLTAAISVMLIHKGATGLTIKEKQESKES